MASLFWKGNKIIKPIWFLPSSRNHSSFPCPPYKQAFTVAIQRQGMSEKFSIHFTALLRTKGVMKQANIIKRQQLRKTFWGEQWSSATDELSSWCRKYLIYTLSAEWIGWTKVSTSAQDCMALITASLSGLHMLAEILTMRWINTWKHLPAWRHKAEVLNNDGWTSKEIIGSI